MSCPPPGDLPKPGVKPRSPAVQADSLLSEPPGKPSFLDSLYYFMSLRLFPCSFPFLKSGRFYLPLFLLGNIFNLPLSLTPTDNLVATIMHPTKQHDTPFKPSNAFPCLMFCSSVSLHVRKYFFQLVIQHREIYNILKLISPHSLFETYLLLFPGKSILLLFIKFLYITVLLCIWGEFYLMT